MINVAVLGACGKMGQGILSILNNLKDKFKIKGAIDRKDSCFIGKKIFGDSEIRFSYDLELVAEEVDVFIDFSFHEATVKNLEILKKYKKSIVIGTTGFTEEEKKQIIDASKFIKIVFSPNMSIGVNIFFKILKDASVLLKDYDMEIVEIHHNKKKDAPSGTALKIANILLENADKKKIVCSRNGNIGEREKDEVGISSVRLGDVVGEHNVMFSGNNERIELIHRAHNRYNFAYGAIKAAEWIVLNKESKGLFDMFDVLGISK